MSAPMRTGSPMKHLNLPTQPQALKAGILCRCSFLGWPQKTLHCSTRRATATPIANMRSVCMASHRIHRVPEPRVTVCLGIDPCTTGLHTLICASLGTWYTCRGHRWNSTLGNVFDVLTLNLKELRGDSQPERVAHSAILKNKNLGQTSSMASSAGHRRSPASEHPVS